MKPELQEKIEDFVEKRMESFIQVQQKLHEDYHNKMINAVEVQIKTTVNGKIDAIKKQLDKQDIVLEDIAWLAEFSKGASLIRKPILWVVGFIITTVALFGGIRNLLNIFLPK